jgi:hypothetical protein
VRAGIGMVGIDRSQPYRVGVGMWPGLGMAQQPACPAIPSGVPPSFTFAVGGSPIHRSKMGSAPPCAAVARPRPRTSEAGFPNIPACTVEPYRRPARLMFEGELDGIARPRVQPAVRIKIVNGD